MSDFSNLSIVIDPHVLGKFICIMYICHSSDRLVRNTLCAFSKRSISSVVFVHLVRQCPIYNESLVPGRNKPHDHMGPKNTNYFWLPQAEYGIKHYKLYIKSFLRPSRRYFQEPILPIAFVFVSPNQVSPI